MNSLYLEALKQYDAANQKEPLPANLCGGALDAFEAGLVSHVAGLVLAPVSGAGHLCTGLLAGRARDLKTAAVDLSIFALSVAPYALAIGTGHWGWALTDPNNAIALAMAFRMTWHRPLLSSNL